MFDEVVFYNHFGNGDVFISKEFVREMFYKIRANEYTYAHQKSPRILEDMPFIRHRRISDKEHGMQAWKVEDNKLYINTWIGRDSKYVLPGIGCTLEGYHRMFREMQIPGYYPEMELYSYFPTVDYTQLLYKDTIKSFINGRPDNPMVLISNGDVQSNQAMNFDFFPIIDRVTDYFPSIDFILTQYTTLNKPNIFYTGDIVNSEDGCDLNEIGYLSTYCDTIIGRSSGPYVFCQTAQNYKDKTKSFLSFTYTEVAAHFSYSLPIHAKKFWSPRTDTEGVYEKIKAVILCGQQ
jgi:hypothetical protein